MLAAADRHPAGGIFTFEQRRLPCWRDQDLEVYDDWLVHPRNFPVYYALFEQLAAERPGCACWRSAYAPATLGRRLPGP